MNLFFRFFEIPRFWKRLITLTVDVVFICAAYFLAFYVRVGEGALDRWITGEHIVVLLITCALSLGFWINLGLYRAVIRYLDVKVLSNLAMSAIFSATVLLVASYLFKADMPRSVPFIFLAFILILTAGSRLLVRGLINSRNKQHKEKVIIYGAGSSGRQLCLSLQHGDEYLPVAFIDHSEILQSSEVAGVKVHSPDMLSELVKTYHVKKVLLAIPSATVSQRKAIIKSVECLKVRMLTIPGSADLVSGKYNHANLREVEINDLLGREAVPVQPELLEKCITEKYVLVTGAGGSIGSELCRQIAKLRPKGVILLDVAEFNLYSVEHEITNKFPDVKLIPILGSVLDTVLLDELFQTYKINTVYHAAAYKHVPLVEQNTKAGLVNNVIGTQNVAELANKHNIGHFVLVSTDKAVRPTNIMGASKRLAELVVQTLAEGSVTTVFSMVRFGNVLGSSGSVVPLFKRQISMGGPVTGTHPEITRYFMTIPEAASLVIQAGAMAKGGEVFVLDMGAPVKIRDLAENMISLMGLDVKSDANPDGDIEIIFSGLRPGEKLFEELLIGNTVDKTSHARIMKAKEVKLSPERLNDLLIEIAKLLDSGDMATLRELLMTAHLGYSPVSEMVDIFYTQRSEAKVAQSSDVGATLTH